MPNEIVVLVHGLWVNGLEMGWLRRCLESAGYQAVQFSYPSITNTPFENAMDLNAMAERLPAETVHFVGHSLGGIVIRHLFYHFPRQRPGRIVTSGPFHLTYWRQRDKFELRRSATFWGRDAVRLARVTIYSINDQSAAANLYYQGACDATTTNNVPSSYLPVLAGEAGPTGRPKLDYVRAPYNGIYFYLVNVKRLDNVHLRRALSHALDRSRLPLILKGGQIPTTSMTPGKPIAQLTAEERALCGVDGDAPGLAAIVVKGQACYLPPPGPGYDPERARAELARAKAEMGARFPAVIHVKFNTGVESHKHIAEWIQREWQERLGLRVELESQEWKVFLKDTANLEYDVARMGSIGNLPDPEAEFLNQMKCESPDNRTGWCSARFDELYRKAEAEPDRRRRLAYAREAEAIMLDEAPIVPLYVYTQHVLAKPYVRGLAVNLFDQQSLRDVWIDPDWRKAGPGPGAAR